MCQPICIKDLAPQVESERKSQEDYRERNVMIETICEK